MNADHRYSYRAQCEWPLYQDETTDNLEKFVNAYLTWFQTNGVHSLLQFFDFTGLQTDHNIVKRVKDYALARIVIHCAYSEQMNSYNFICNL